MGNPEAVGCRRYIKTIEKNGTGVYNCNVDKS
jgi:hypothetical protein